MKPKWSKKPNTTTGLYMYECVCTAVILSVRSRHLELIKDSHLIFLINLPDNFINQELLLKELLVSLLFLALVAQELLLQLSLILQRLLVLFLLQLLLFTCCLLLLAVPVTSKGCLLTLVTGKRKAQHWLYLTCTGREFVIVFIFYIVSVWKNEKFSPFSQTSWPPAQQSVQLFPYSHKQT